MGGGVGSHWHGESCGGCDAGTVGIFVGGDVDGSGRLGRHVELVEVAIKERSWGAKRFI